MVNNPKGDSNGNAVREMEGQEEIVLLSKRAKEDGTRLQIYHQINKLLKTAGTCWHFFRSPFLPGHRWEPTPGVLANTESSAQQNALSQNGLSQNGYGQPATAGTDRDRDDDGDANGNVNGVSTVTTPCDAPHRPPRRLEREEARWLPPSSMHQACLAQLDEISLATTLRDRCFTLQGVPGFMRGAFKIILRTGLSEIVRCREIDLPGEIRGWKLFLRSSRMLLHRAPGQTTIPRDELEQRLATFKRGDWLQLLRQSGALIVSSRRDQTPVEITLESRAEWAAALASLGELSAAADALVSDPLAPLSDATFAELSDPDRRPQQVPDDDRANADDLNYEPPAPFQLDQRIYLANVRRARRGAAAGPSGVTAEHHRLLLDDDDSARLLLTAAQQLASAKLPASIVAGLRLGRMVALQKPNGRIRGLVMGDIFRRTVVRTIAQQMAESFQDACSPHQYALTTRAGTECISRALRYLTEQNPQATII